MISNILKNVSWLIVDKIASILIGLILLVKVANHYGPDIYGIYQYAVSISVLISLTGFFLDGRIVKKYYVKDSPHIIIFNSNIIKFCLGILSLVVGIPVIYVLNLEYLFNVIFILYLINNLIINLSYGLQNYFEYVLKSKNIVIATNISSIISLLLQVITVYLSFSIVYIAAIIVFSSIIKISLIYIQFKSHFDIRLISKIKYKLIYNLLKESAPLAIAATASILYMRIDQVMIGMMLSVSDVGIYSISVQMASAITIVLVPMQVSLFPKMIELFNKNLEEYYKLIQNVTVLISSLSVMSIIFIYVLGFHFFNLLFDQSYSESFSIFKILIIGTYFMYNAILRSSHFTIINQTKILLISQIISVFINIILNYFLIRYFGVNGAAFATVITLFISLQLANIFFCEGRKVFYMQITNIFSINIFQKNYLKKMIYIFKN